MHTLSATTESLTANFNLKPAITNVNSNGLTTNCTISCTAMTLNRFAYNKLTGVGDDIKTKPYEDIKQKQTALFYGNIAKSVNEGTTNE